MKRTLYFVLAATLVVLVSSCDGNKGKVKEMTEQFIAALNSGDRAGIYDIYPTAKNYTNLQMVGNIAEGDLSVARDDSTGLYTVSIANQRQQKLVFTADSLGQVTLIDSYGILLLDSLSGELALKCGVPIKRLSDVEQANLMNEESVFIEYLKSKHTESYGSIYAGMGSYNGGKNSTGFFCTVHIPVTNTGNQLVMGSEYSLEVKCYASNNPDGVSISKSLDGKDISAGETRAFEFDEPGLYNWAKAHNLSFTATVKYRNNSFVSRLLQYATFTGNEYSDFKADETNLTIKHKGKFAIALNEEQGHIDCFAQPSKQGKVTGTAYHRQLITVVSDPEHEGWSKAYTSEDYNETFTLLGYISNDEWQPNEEWVEIKPLDIHKYTVYNYEGGDVPLYKEASKKSDVVKQLKPDTEILSATDPDDWAAETMAVYEPDGKGGYKVVGYIPTENAMDPDWD